MEASAWPHSGMKRKKNMNGKGCKVDDREILSFLPFLLPQPEAGRLTVVTVNCVELLADPDEGGPAAQLLQFPRPDVGAGGAHPAQHVPYRDLHRTFVGDLHRLPLRRSGVSNSTRRLVLTGSKPPQAGNEGAPVLSHASRVLLHGRVGAHSVEQLVLLPVFLNDLPPALRVAGEHPAQHHEIGSGA